MNSKLHSAFIKYVNYHCYLLIRSSIQYVLHHGCKATTLSAATESNESPLPLRIISFTIMFHIPTSIFYRSLNIYVTYLLRINNTFWKVGQVNMNVNLDMTFLIFILWTLLILSVSNFPRKFQKNGARRTELHSGNFFTQTGPSTFVACAHRSTCNSTSCRRRADI